MDPTGEFPFAVDDYVLHLLAAIHQFRDSALDGALRPSQMNVGRYRVLGVVHQFGPCSMTELANFTAIDRTTLTRIADQLVRAAWVERKAAAKDRRQVLLELTQAGRESYLAARRVVFDLNGRLMEGLLEHERRTTARVLIRVVEKLTNDAAARDSIIFFSREGLVQDKAKGAPATRP